MNTREVNPSCPYGCMADDHNDPCRWEDHHHQQAALDYLEHGDAACAQVHAILALARAVEFVRGPWS